MASADSSIYTTGMKRLFLLVLLCLTVLLGIQLPTSVAAADVNDFIISNFQGDYYLDKDADNHSVMQVTEQITVAFPTYNQNKGLVRAIPRVYDGHSVEISDVTVTRNGQPEPIYRTYTQNNNKVVETGTDQYVTGSQQYTFSYTLHDVIKDFGNHQELYWDINGTEWKQRFGNVTATFHFSDQVQPGFTGKIDCYQGLAGSNASCIQSSTTDDSATFSSGPLSTGGNLTAVMQFAKDTFVPYQPTIGERLAHLAPLLISTYMAAGLITALWLKFKKGKGAPGRGSIVREYLPPKETSILQAAQVYPRARNKFAAQYIDLTVRHNLRLYETEPKSNGFFIQFYLRKSYELELLSLDDLNSDELAVVTALFGANPALGSRYPIGGRMDTSLMSKLEKLNKRIAKESVSSRNLIREAKTMRATVYALGISALILAALNAFVISFKLGSSDPGIASFALVIVGIVYVQIMIVIGVNIRPLTEQGKALQEYLKGLKDYIAQAETERIAALQSPDGAAKVGVDTSDRSQIIHLYERVLPYAILFGLEKEWGKVLGDYYEQQNLSPSWYVSPNGFNSAVFATSMSNFTSVAGSYSSPSSSGSSGMGGGGFSGGGGGGGGGGGR